MWERGEGWVIEMLLHLNPHYLRFSPSEILSTSPTIFFGGKFQPSQKKTNGGPDIRQTHYGFFYKKGQGAAYLRLRVAVVEDHAEELGRRLQGGLLVHLATRSHRIICSCWSRPSVCYNGWLAQSNYQNHYSSNYVTRFIPRLVSGIWIGI